MQKRREEKVVEMQRRHSRCGQRGVEEVGLQIWEDYFKELLNQRKNSQLELPSAEEGKVNLEEIVDLQVDRATKTMKRGRATGIDEVRVEMLVMDERVGAKWTRRCLHERGEDPGGVADGVDSPCIEKKRRCSRPWKIPRYQVAESVFESVKENSGWSDKEDSGV